MLPTCTFQLFFLWKNTYLHHTSQINSILAWYVDTIDCKHRCPPGSTIQVTVLLFRYRVDLFIVLLTDADRNYCFQVTYIWWTCGKGSDTGTRCQSPFNRDSSRAVWELHNPLFSLELDSWGPFISDEVFHVWGLTHRVPTKHQLQSLFCIFNYMRCLCLLHFTIQMCFQCGCFAWHGHISPISTTAGWFESLLEGSYNRQAVTSWM